MSNKARHADLKYELASCDTKTVKVVSLEESSVTRNYMTFVKNANSAT